MDNNKLFSKDGFFLGLFVAIGLISLGVLLSSAIIKVKDMDRTVSVKGLAVKDVKADIAIYPIQFEVADNTPSGLYNKIKTKKNIVMNFLKQQGFKDSDIYISSPQIVDNFAKDYNSNTRFRYTGTIVITLYTKKVDKTIQLGKKLLKLSEQGVMVSNLKYQTSYLYTKLNEIKPAMIEEATFNARKAAEKFALDSHSKLNGIKSAKQGYFSIVDRDISTPYIKRIRVVTNIVYYIK